MSLLSFVIPTRDRHDELLETLGLLGEVPVRTLGGGAPRVIIVDNGSDPPASEVVPAACANGLRVEVIRLDENIGAAARNIGAQATASEWVVMLDDDSAPVAGDLAGTLGALPDAVAAYGAEIVLPGGGREAGGLPEVVVGCGCAFRRSRFLGVGGYDPTFDYYAEEYDLCAKLIGAGHAVRHGRGVRIEHRKVTAGRDFGRILHRLVRNNAWVATRYAPDAARGVAIREVYRRYGAIANTECVPDAFVRGRADAEATLSAQARTPLNDADWRRFTGAAAVDRCLIRELGARGVDRVALVARGKGAEVIRSVLDERGVSVDADAGVRVIATLSPGPMLDAAERDPEALLPWSCTGEWPLDLTDG